MPRGTIPRDSAASGVTSAKSATEQQPTQIVDTQLTGALERFNQGAYDEALVLYREALSIDSANRRAQDGIASVTAAKSAEQRVLQRPPAAGAANQKNADVNAQAAGDIVRAEDAFRLGQYDQAISIFQAVLRLDASNAAARAGLQKAQRAKAAEELILKKKQDR